MKLRVVETNDYDLIIQHIGHPNDLKHVRNRLVESDGIDPESIVIHPDDMRDWQKQAIKNQIDTTLSEQYGIDQRKQLTTTANASQLALYAASVLIKYHTSTGAEKKALQQELKKMLPMADQFIDNIGKMPAGFLGLSKVAPDVIQTSVNAGLGVKQVLSQVAQSNQVKKQSKQDIK